MLLQKPPTKICGIEIDTDFKKWLRVGRVLQARELHDLEKPDIILTNVFGNMDGDPLALFEGVVDFYNCGHEDRGLPPPKEIPYHWERDSATIWADFFIYVRMDLDKETMHWWRFRALFDSLPPESGIKTLMRIRAEDPADYHGKGLEKERAKMWERKRAAAVWPIEYDD